MIYFKTDIQNRRFFLISTFFDRGIVEMYMDYLEGCGSKILNVFDILLKNEGVIIINCKYGKDRTGLICILIMLLCDVSDDVIILEYARSFINLDNELIKLQMINDFKNCGLPEAFIYSTQVYMCDLLRNFRKKYDSVYLYLNDIGFDYLRQKLFIKKYKIFFRV